MQSDEVLERAIEEFAAALDHAADSARVRHLANVGRARALLGLGRLDEAAAVAATVPTSYIHHAEYGAGFTWNDLGTTTPFYRRTRGVGNRLGGNGLDYVEANDPRVRVTQIDTADDGTPIYSPGKYPDETAPVVLASGVEARLLEAEAALASGDPAWLTILNELRSTEIDPPLPPLLDPGAPDTRVDLVFRERAFWLFLTGRRLGDLRRLIRHYGRSPDAVFPTGSYRLGGAYGSSTSIPFPAALEAVHNAAVTGCVDG